jgi:hypothetical protein
MWLAAPVVVFTSSLAFAQPPLTQAEIDALAENPAINAAIVACSDDRWRVCGGVFPGGGRIARCLAANAESLSPACRSAMIAARDTIAASRGVPYPVPAK